MSTKHLVCAALLLAPAAAPAAILYRADLGQVNASGASGFIDFSLDGNLLSVDLEATGLADGPHFLHIHGLDAAPGVPINTIAPPPPLPPNGDANRNGVVSTDEAKAAIGGVILSLAPHEPGTSAELSGVASTGGALSFTATYDLSTDIYEPNYSRADLLPLDLRVFDMHGGIVPQGIVPDGTTLAPGLFDPNLPIAAGKIALVGGAVPEPASWALMIAGFGLVGATLRQRRSTVRFG